MPDRSLKDIFPQFENHIPHHPGGKELVDVVEGPGRDAQQQHAGGHQQHNLEGWVQCHQVNGFGDQDGTAAPGRRVQRNGDGDQDHLAPKRPEVIRNPAQQFPIAIIAVVVLGVEAV